MTSIKFVGREKQIAKGKWRLQDGNLSASRVKGSGESLDNGSLSAAEKIWLSSPQTGELESIPIASVSNMIGIPSP